MSNKRESSKTLPRLTSHVHLHCILVINCYVKSVNIKLAIFKVGNDASLHANVHIIVILVMSPDTDDIVN